MSCRDNNLIIPQNLSNPLLLIMELPIHKLHEEDGQTDQMSYLHIVQYPGDYVNSALLNLSRLDIKTIRTSQ